MKKTLFSFAFIAIFVTIAVCIGCSGGDKPNKLAIDCGFLEIDTAGGSFTDSRDGQVYRTVKIGAHTWMAENLNYKSDTSWCFDKDKKNCRKYGRLYDWDTAMAVCPAGWRLPARAEWDDLIGAAGGILVAGKALKATRPQWDGTDSFGFSALPVEESYLRNGSFNSASIFGVWWSAADFGSSGAYRRNVRSEHEYVYEYLDDKSYGFSVRCVMSNNT